MATASPDDLREELRQLGAERKADEAGRKKLHKQINTKLARIERAGISKSEAARLLGVHRTTLYRVYKV